MQHRNSFSEAVGGFGEPFRYQAGPFVSRPTAIYEHSQSSFGAEAVAPVDQDRKPGLLDRAFEEPYQEQSGFDELQAAGVLILANYALSAGGLFAGVYHGYKRTESVGWALGWGLLGSIWPIGIPLMLAQGFGKPQKK